MKTFMTDPRQVGEGLPDHSIVRCIELFLTGRRRERLAESTVNWYGSRLRRTLELYLNRPISAFDTDRELLMIVRGTVLGTHQTAETANGHLAALKAFLYWAIDVGFLTLVNPRRLKKVKVEAKLPKHLTDDEVARLLATYDVGNIYELRDLTITSLMLDTGLRVGETLGLRVDDFDPRSNQLTIRNTKGKRDRVVAMSLPMHSRMTEWHGLRTRMGEDVGEWMFPSRESPQLSQRWYNTSLKRHAAVAGIVRQMSAHVLRFTYATSCLNAGMNPAELQHALGHANIAMSMHYAAMHDSRSHAQSVAASPLTRIPEVGRRGGMRGIKRAVA
jgi:integrase/recombinase XerD